MNWDPKPYNDPLNPSCPGCGLCKSVGWHKITGKIQWCTCEAAADRRLLEPGLIEELEREAVDFERRFA